MKATELRVGNIISDTVEGFTAMLSSFAGSLESPICEVIEVYSESALVKYVDSSEALECCIEYSEIEPVKLTDEWFLRFGFEINRYTEYLYDYDLKCTPPNYRKEFKISARFGETKQTINKLSRIQWMPEFSGESHSFPCEYVHQLQNLFFALTGTELTIK